MSVKELIKSAQVKPDLKDSATNLPVILGDHVLPNILQFQQAAPVLHLHPGVCLVVAGVSAFLIAAYLQQKSRMIKLVQLLQISSSILCLNDKN